MINICNSALEYEIYIYIISKKEKLMKLEFPDESFYCISIEETEETEETPTGRRETGWDRMTLALAAVGGCVALSLVGVVVGFACVRWVGRGWVEWDGVE